MDLLDVFVKLGVKDMASQAIAGIASKTKSTLSAAASVAGKAVTAGVAAVSAGVVAMGKASLDAYKDYEQLSGGIQKLFGAGGQSLEQYAASVGKTTAEARGKFDSLMQGQAEVMQNAQNAFATAGMSANQYMEQVSGFSAALISSLGGDTVAAAKRADVAMRAISDNVNTFGSDMQSVQAAFQGFAKQNYTMLDNLKLGYGGTKEEMERLIADANEYAASIGEASNLSIESFADVVQAIELIQEKQGIAGTTAREAAQTIEGSINATKAAWENFLAELGKNDGDIGARINELATSATNVVNNILPRLKQIAEGIGNAIPELLPKAVELGGTILKAVGEGIVTSVPAVLASIGEAAGQLVDEIAAGLEALPERIPEIIDNFKIELLKFSVGFEQFFSGEGDTGEAVSRIGTALQDIASAAMEYLSSEKVSTSIRNSAERIFNSLGSFLSTQIENLPTHLANATIAVAHVGWDIIDAIGSGIVDNAPGLLDTALNAISNALDGLTAIVDEISAHLQEGGPSVFEGAEVLFQNILNALMEKGPQIFDSLLGLLGSLVNLVITNAPSMLTGAITFIGNILTAIITNLPGILGGLLSMVGQLIQTVIDNAPGMLSAAGQLIGEVANAIGNAVGDVLTAIGNLVQRGVDKVGEFFNSMYNAGRNIIQGLIDGIGSLIGSIASTISNGVSNAINTAKGLLQIASPSKVFYEIGQFTMEGFANGIADAAYMAEDAMAAATKSVYDAANGKFDIGFNTYTGRYDSMAYAASGWPTGGDTYNVTLQIEAGADANQMALDFAEAIRTRNRLGGRASAVNTRMV